MTSFCTYCWTESDKTECLFVGTNCTYQYLPLRSAYLFALTISRCYTNSSNSVKNA